MLTYITGGGVAQVDDRLKTSRSDQKRETIPEV